MPSPRSPGRFIAIGSAALLIQIGAAAAAHPPSLQERMQEVLTGSIALDATPRAEAHRHEDTELVTDSQAFARRLLLGWSASAVHGMPGRRLRDATSNAGGHEDTQTLVRRQLLGETD